MTRTLEAPPGAPNVDLIPLLQLMQKRRYIFRGLPTNQLRPWLARAAGLVNETDGALSPELVEELNEKADAAHSDFGRTIATALRAERAICSGDADHAASIPLAARIIKRQVLEELTRVGALFQR